MRVSLLRSLAATACIGLLQMGCQSGSVGHEPVSQCYPAGACDEAMFEAGLRGGVVDLARGSALYAQHCSSCHGADGVGGVGYDATRNINFTSAVWHASMTDEAIANVVLQGRAPLMPALLLNEGQLRDLLGHLRSLKTGTAPPPTVAPSAAPSGSGY